MKQLKRICLIILSIIIVAVSVPMNTYAANTEMTIYSLYCGKNLNGEATLIKSGNEYLLMDVGVRESYSSINNALKSLGVTHFSLYISHFHGDHTGGFGSSDDEEGSSSVNTASTPSIENFMKDYVIDKVYLPDPSILKYKGKTVEENEDVYYRKIKEFYEASSLQTKNYDTQVVNYLKCGDKFSFGSVKVDIIGPVEDDKIGRNSFSSPYKNGKIDRFSLDTYQNNCSLVAKLTCGTTTYLTAGDLKPEGEQALIKKYGEKGLKSTIYKMNHHGFYPANTEKFIDCVKPDYSFVSNYSGAGLGSDKFWRVHTAQFNCLKYGFVYLAGQENCGLTINVKNDVVSLYKFGSKTKLNAPGWTKVKGNDGKDRQYDYFYFGNDGKTLKGVQKIDGKYYYFGTGGYRHNGTGKGSSYHGMTTCKEDNKKRYFAESDCSMYVGFHAINDGTYNGLYYFDKKTGVLKTPTNGKDWQKIKIGDYYYSLYKTGKLSQNALHQYDGYDNYFGADGKMLTGWNTIKGKKYYFDPKTGARYTGVRKIGKDKYLFSDYGALITNAKRTIKGKIYYFDSKGKMAKGWKKISGKKYYFNPKTGAATIGLAQIDNEFYMFSNYGILVTNTKRTIGGKKYSIDANGKINVKKPSKTKIKKIKAGKKAISVSWAKVKGVKGYEIEYSTSKKFTNSKKITVNAKNTKYNIKKLSSKKTYYVRIRTYTNFQGMKAYSKYSNVMKATVK